MGSLKKCGGIMFLCSIVLLAHADAASQSTSANTDSTRKAHLGYPSDWSARHLILATGNADKALLEARHDPRHVYNMVQRMVAVRNTTRVARMRSKPAIKVDWAVSLENGYVPANQFPAKYRFDVSTEDCNADFVLFGLTVTSGTQANIVGINNLYTTGSSPCNGGNPYIAFAYNASLHGGQISTSPVISMSGQKIAFVESASIGSYFHVLVLPNPIPTPPVQAGTVLSPLTPTVCAIADAPNCITDTFLSSGANSNSSPWIDYDSDTAYVGTDDGLLHKVSGVFGGITPQADVDSANWPVTVSTQPNSVLTGAVVDNNAGKVFVGDGYGYLYSLNLTNPGKTTAAQVAIGWVSHGAGTGVVDPPIAVNDPANSSVDQVFAFSGCSNTIGVGGTATQMPANFTSSTTPTQIDLGSASGAGDCTGGDVHGGTFDNQFWLTGSNGGHLVACGFVSGTNRRPLVPSNPQMYWLRFDGTHTITDTNEKKFAILSTKGDECSPLTEFFDGATDRLFFGVGGTDGYVKSSNLTSTSISTPATCSATKPSSSCVTTPAANGGTSGIIIDNELSSTGGANIYFSTLGRGGSSGQKCNVSGGNSNPYCAIKLTQSGLQ